MQDRIGANRTVDDMNLPTPAWAPVQPGMVVPRRPVRPERRRLGWTLIGVAVLIVLGLVLTVGRSAYGLMSGHERVTMPGEVSVSCHEGDAWRIGPATGRSRSYGPVTVDSSREVALETVTVEMDGRDVPLHEMRSNETFEWFGTTYTAVASFTCPSAGTAVVSFSGPAGSDAAVFPSFWRVMRAMLWLMAGLVVTTPVAVVGIVLAVRHRRSLQPR